MSPMLAISRAAATTARRLRTSTLWQWKAPRSRTPARWHGRSRRADPRRGSSRCAPRRIERITTFFDLPPTILTSWASRRRPNGKDEACPRRRRRTSAVRATEGIRNEAPSWFLRLHEALEALGYTG
jgi:hypothetical protein